MHAKWSIRLGAYKEINTRFYTDYSQFTESKNSPEYGARGDP